MLVVMRINDIAFTPAVQAIQAERGSRAAYAKAHDWQQEIDEELAAFLAAQTSCFLATTNARGQPYVQHRGGPPGFLRVLDAHTLAFADYRGNRQYITLGNLAENPKVHLLLIDHARGTRIKIWGEAQVVAPPADDKRAEQTIVIRVVAWDVNCPRYIPRLVDAGMVARVLAERDATIAERDAQLAERDARIAAQHARIAALEAELAHLRDATSPRARTGTA